MNKIDNNVSIYNDRFIFGIEQLFNRVLYRLILTGFNSLAPSKLNYRQLVFKMKGHGET